MYDFVNNSRRRYCDMQNINEIKDRICDVCHKTWQLGWVAANDGNVSARLENGNIIATPTGMSKSFITPDKLILLDSKGRILQQILDSIISIHQDTDELGTVHHASPAKCDNQIDINR